MAGIYRLTVRLTFPTGSQHGTNTWHYRSTSVPAPPAPSIPNAIKTFYTALITFMATGYQFTWDGNLAQVDSTDPPVLGGFTPWTVTGTGGNLQGPAGVGAVVCWRSGTATRSGRGRTFLAPLTTGALDNVNGTIENGTLTAMRNAANALVSTSLADGNGAVSIWSPTHRIGRDVQTATINDKVAFLSSRRS